MTGSLVAAAVIGFFVGSAFRGAPHSRKRT
jgi:cytochrome bd-type quinol oxidase subunit 2